MRTPIAHALAWPERMVTPGERLNLEKMSNLTFEKPDFVRFSALAKAYECLEKGPYACITLNAANEIAVDAFLTNRIGFLDIIACIDHILGCMKPQDLATLQDIQDYDGEARKQAEVWVLNGVTKKVVSAL